MNLLDEVWKDIEGYEGAYQVSNLGNVRSTTREVIYPGGYSRVFRGKVLKPRVDKYGYLVVGLSKHQHHKWLKIHRLVAKAFLNNPNEYDQVNHLDGDKTNNNVSNLEWCNNSMNMKHAVETGLKPVNGRKSVLQIKDGVVIDVFPSVTAAANYICMSRTHISGCCNGHLDHKTAGGYEWRFADVSN